jgi:hypothetical protein
VASEEALCPCVGPCATSGFGGGCVSPVSPSSLRIGVKLAIGVASCVPVPGLKPDPRDTPSCWCMSLIAASTAGSAARAGLLEKLNPELIEGRGSIERAGRAM